MLVKMKKILLTSLATLSCLSFSDGFAVDSTSTAIVPQNMQQGGMFVLANGRQDLLYPTDPAAGFTFPVSFQCPKNFNPYAQISIVGADPSTYEPIIPQNFKVCLVNVEKAQNTTSTNITIKSKGTYMNTQLLKESTSSLRVWGLLGGSGPNSGLRYSINWTLYCYPTALPNQPDPRPTPLPDPNC